AVVRDPVRADAMLEEQPELLDARWIHNETVLHFLAIEGFADGVRFLASRGADVNAVNEFGDTALVDVASLGLAGIVGILLTPGARPDAQRRTHAPPRRPARWPSENARPRAARGSLAGAWRRGPPTPAGRSRCDVLHGARRDCVRR